jgi:15-cis-phytoene synthase
VLEASLSPEVRLALAYAPSRMRPLQLGAFALDARLAGIVTSAREPILAQLKLAWWRDRLMQTPEQRPQGEPVLAALAEWQGDTAPLLALLDGWEAMLDHDDREAGVLRLAEARAALGAGLAMQAEAGAAGTAAAALRSWSLAEHGAGQDRLPPIRLPRALRTLAVLYGLARRRHTPGQVLDGPVALAAAVRIGMVGR